MEVIYKVLHKVYLNEFWKTYEGLVDVDIGGVSKIPNGHDPKSQVIKRTFVSM